MKIRLQDPENGMVMYLDVEMRLDKKKRECRPAMYVPELGRYMDIEDWHLGSGQVVSASGDELELFEEWRP